MAQENNSPKKSNHQKPVWVYLAILFVVALGLILFSLAMHHRENTIALAASLLPWGKALIHML